MSEYRLTRQLSLVATAAFLPLTIIDNKDTHHLRPDLQQNPSISMEGWGVGADADIDEYLATCLGIGIRLAALPTVDDGRRLRLLVWIDALLKRLK